MEGIPASSRTILVSTRTVRVTVATTSYNGGLSNVALYVSSNVVVSAVSANNCIIYATGSITCIGATGPFNRSGTNVSLTNIGDRVGMGTASPSAKLHITGGNTNDLMVDNGGEQFTELDFLNNGATKASVWWNNTATTFHFQGAGASMDFNGNNVGIDGATTPGSTLTVAGRIESTGGGYKFPDGSIQVVAYRVFSSTYTTWNSNSSSFSTLAPGVDGSTITMTTVAGPVDLIFSGAGTNATGGAGCIISVGVDGAPVDGFSNSLGITGGANNANGTDGRFNLGFHYRIKANLTAASHSFYISFIASGGGTCTLLCSTVGPCSFEAREFR